MKRRSGNMKKSQKFVHYWVLVFKGLVTQKFIKACHCSRVDVDLKITFTLGIPLKCRLDQRCDAHTDNLHQIAPVNRSQKNCVYYQVGPKISDRPQAEEF